MTTADKNNLTSHDAPTSLSEWLAYTCMWCGFSVSAPTLETLLPMQEAHAQECPELRADLPAAGFSARHAALFAAVNLSAAYAGSEGRLSTPMVLRVARVFEDYLAGRVTSSSEEAD